MNVRMFSLLEPLTNWARHLKSFAKLPPATNLLNTQIQNESRTVQTRYLYIIYLTSFYFHLDHVIKSIDQSMIFK